MESDKEIVLRGPTEIVDAEFVEVPPRPTQAPATAPAPEASADVVQQERAVPSATAPAPEASAGFGGVSSVHQPGMSAHELASALAYVVQALPKSKDDPLLRRIYLAVEAQPGTGGRRLALVAHDTYRAHAAYVRLPDSVTVTPQAISAERAERLRLECETAVKTGYTSSVHVQSALLWEMHDGFEPKTLELGHALDTDTWPMPAAIDGPAPPMRHELKHGRQALSYRSEEKPAERSFVDGQGFKFVVLTDGSGLEVAKARIAPIGWHDEEPTKEDKRQGVIPGTKPSSAQEPTPTEAKAEPSKPKKPRKPQSPKAPLQLEASTETKSKKPRRAKTSKAAKGKGKK